MSCSRNTEAELEEIGKDIAKDTLTGIFAYAEDVAVRPQYILCKHFQKEANSQRRKPTYSL